METKVLCPNCGTSFKIGEHEHVSTGIVIGKDSGLGNVFLTPDTVANKNKIEKKENKTMTKADQRIAELQARGIDTKDYFSIQNGNGEGVLMKWENGVPVAVPMEDKNDPILEQIISDGYVANSKLHRRWVLAQMMRGLNYKGYKGTGYEAYVRSHGYNYQFSMMLEEIRVISKLEVRDREAFEERTTFFDKDVVVNTCKDYLDKLKKRVDELKIRHCKGVPYKKVNGHDIFVDDLRAKLYWPIEQEINRINRSKNYTELYNSLNWFIRKYVNRYKLPSDTPMAYAWKEAYKGSGSYYSLLNLLKYHELYIKVDKYDARTGSAGVAYVQSFLQQYKGDGYRYFAMLKKCLKDNNFDFAARMRELGVEGYEGLNYTFIN